jgi:hypothetical protein
MATNRIKKTTDTRYMFSSGRAAYNNEKVTQRETAKLPTSLDELDRLLKRKDDDDAPG